LQKIYLTNPFIMRKNIFAYLLLFVSTNLFAQYYDTNQNIDRLLGSIDFSKVQFGLKVTPAISWINADHNDMGVEGAAMKFGVGAVAEYPITNTFFFVSGLNFHGFGGYAYDNHSLGFSDTLTTFKINYKEIEIPFALKLQTKTIQKTSYFLQGGVSVGFVLDANEKYFPADTNLEPEYVNINNYTNPTRIAYQLGAGMNYHFFGNSKIFGLISYNSAISNIANSINYTSGTNPRYTSPIRILPGSMEFSIGIMF